MWEHYDKETRIITNYLCYIEGVDVEVNDGWHTGATVSLNHQPWSTSRGWEMLYGTRDCPKLVHWKPPKPKYFGRSVAVEYWADGYMLQEVLSTYAEACEVASRAAYNGRNIAHINITRTLSLGTSTIWFKVERDREYGESIEIDVSFCVEFGNSEECTRFLHEEIWELQNQYIEDKESNVASINAIMRALVPIHNNLLTAEEDAAQRCVPYSQFIDECSQPETQLIHHRGANRGDDRPCYVTLQITISDASSISGIGWTATNIPPAVPSRPSAFRSLSTLHLKFPSRQSQERTDNSASSSHHEDLTITISAREITFIDGTNSTSAGNSFSVNSVHRTVNINYINNTGDAFLAPISSSNVGGQNNVNTIVMEPPPDSQSPVELSRAQGILLALARRRARLRPKKAEQSARGTSRSAKLRTQRAGPY